MSNIPDFLVDMLNVQYGEEIVEEILKGYKLKKRTTLRINTLKCSVEEIEEELTKKGIVFKKVDWYKDVLVLENGKEEEIRLFPFYKNGKVYLQNLSSMLPPLVIDPNEKESILDMAAAPGGKTTEMVNLSNNKALITAVEKNPIRADRLKYNLSLQGANRVTVLVEDARKLDDFFSFDKILLDAPCSGSGTLDANDIKIKKVFTKELINKSRVLQKELLKKAINLVKQNGEIVYSTCSILKEENEEVLKEFLNSGVVELIPIENNIFKNIPKLPVTIEGTVCVCPTEEYEGFFVAKLKKLARK